MSNNRLRYLLEQYVSENSTPAEVRELFGWIRRSKNDAFLKQKVRELWSVNDSGKDLPDVDWNDIYTKIVNTPVPVMRRSSWLHYGAAVAIIGVLTAGAYFIFQHNAAPPIVSMKTSGSFENDPEPGGNKAILTLANGERIVLDSAGNGALSNQGDVQIVKLGNGQLAYNFSNRSSLPDQTKEILYNTITTPHGGQYQIVLADGSKVWLNAASSLRFPAAFRGEERRVELVGEGYFEVAHDASKPFKVLVNGVEVKVLGTHFNVNAYTDESTMKATLLEGSVMIKDGSASRLISSGQQAQIDNRDGNISDPQIAVQAVDVETVVAWKNGRFIFQGDNIQSIMRQLSRWYNVQVSYAGNVTSEEFVGVISRSRYENISEILSILERTRVVSFSVSGHHITVMPYKE